MQPRRNDFPHFDHPVADPAWHWAPYVAEWQEPPGQIATHIAETFEQSARLLARFSDDQLNQAFWFLVNNSCSDFMHALVDPAVPISLRLRALRSFVPLSSKSWPRGARLTFPTSTNAKQIRSTARATCGGISCPSTAVPSNLSGPNLILRFSACCGACSRFPMMLVGRAHCTASVSGRSTTPRSLGLLRSFSRAHRIFVPNSLHTRSEPKSEMCNEIAEPRRWTEKRGSR